MQELENYSLSSLSGKPCAEPITVRPYLEAEANNDTLEWAESVGGSTTTL